MTGGFILTRGSQAHTHKKTAGYTLGHKFPSPSLPLLLSLSSPGRLWHGNKFLASEHVPELNIGKVALTAITNMGWALLFFFPLQSCWVRFLSTSAMCVSDDERREKNCMRACMFAASVLTNRSRLTWACVQPSHETIISQHVSVWATSHGGYN